MRPKKANLSTVHKKRARRLQARAKVTPKWLSPIKPRENSFSPSKTGVKMKYENNFRLRADPTGSAFNGASYRFFGGDFPRRMD